MLRPQRLSKKQIRASLITRDVDKIAEPAANVYESISIISMRARQISNQIKEELSQKIQEFGSTVDNLEEIFENKEQIEISKHYERLPKPSSIALDEFLAGKVKFERLKPEEEED